VGRSVCAKLDSSCLMKWTSKARQPISKAKKNKRMAKRRACDLILSLMFGADRHVRLFPNEM